MTSPTTHAQTTTGRLLEDAARKVYEAATQAAIAARDAHTAAIETKNQFAEQAALALLENARATREQAKAFFNAAQG